MGFNGGVSLERSIMRILATVAAISAAALCLPGCFEASADGKFQGDGSVQVTVEIGISAQFLAMAQSNKTGAQDPLGSCGNIQRMDEAPKGVKLIDASRGMKGDKVTCRVVAEIADPVVAVGDFERKMKPDDPIILESFKLTRLSAGSYRLESLIEANAKVAEAKSTKPDQGAEAMGKALAVAMMANHYLTLSVTGERIENASGEVSPDKRTVTWRLPVIMFVSPVAGFRQEIRADIIYRESYWGRAKRLIGLD